MNNYYLPAFTREQFHREFAGIIQLSDFATDFPNPRRRYAYTRKELQTQKQHFQNTEPKHLHN